MHMRLIYVLPAILWVVATPARAQTWEKFFYPELGVAIQLPGEPTVTQGSYPTPTGPVPAVIYSVQQDTSTFSLTVADFSSRSGDQRAAVEKALSAIRSSGDVKLDVDECVSGQPGREFSVLGKDGSASKVSVFAVGSRLFLLEAKLLPPNVLRDSGEAARFQQSLSFGSGRVENSQPACRGRAGPASVVSP
jgi:hypothetical protein